MHKKLEAYLARESSEYRFEFRIRGKDQHLHWIRDTGIILSRDADGRPQKMVGTMKLIDEEIRQKEILAESERRFRLLAENSADLISRHDIEGIFLYASPSFRRILGYHDNELIGKSIRDFIHSHDLIYLTRPKEFLTGPELTQRMEYRFRKKDGTFLWVESVVKAIMDELQITVLELQVATRDITERKNAEQALREHERFLASVISSQINGIIVTDTEGKITFSNYAAERILNRKFGTLTGKNIADETLGIWFNPDGISDNPLVSLLRHAIDKRASIPEIERGMRTILGKVKWLSISVSPLYSTENALTGAVISFIDISEKKESSKQLELATERLQIAISGANIDIIDADLTEKQIHVSAELNSRLGKDAQNSSLAFSDLLALIHPEDRQPALELLRRHFQKEIPGLICEIRLRRQDQGWVWFTLRGKLITDAKTGKRRRFSGVLADISDRKENEQHIQKLTQSVMSIAEKERAEISAELHDTVGQGLILAHLNLVNFLQTTGQRSPATDERLLLPIKEVLRTTREISRRLSPIHMREVGIRAAVEEMVTSAGKIANLNIHLDLAALDDFFPEDWDINCYRVIQEALTNTIKHANASQFSVTAERMPRLLAIEIADNGSSAMVENAAPGIGTLIMRERVRTLNGSLVASKRPSGFHIYIEIPEPATKPSSIGIYTEF